MHIPEESRLIYVCMYVCEWYVYIYIYIYGVFIKFESLCVCVWNREYFCVKKCHAII